MPLVQITAPFTTDQVRSLNAYQRAKVMHPFTCTVHSDTPLIAREDGWICPTCAYRQKWAHEFMGNWKWREMKNEIDGKLKRAAT